MKRILCRAAAIFALGLGLAGCVYEPAPAYYPTYGYAPPPPVYYGPPVYGSVVIGGGWGEGHRHWH
jgi:hypothetical protein